jgi:hypothetical protein
MAAIEIHAPSDDEFAEELQEGTPCFVVPVFRPAPWPVSGAQAGGRAVVAPAPASPVKKQAIKPEIRRFFSAATFTFLKRVVPVKPTDGRMKCAECGTQASSVRALRLHCLEHVAQYWCGCSRARQFANLRALKAHRRWDCPKVCHIVSNDRVAEFLAQ